MKKVIALNTPLAIIFPGIPSDRPYTEYNDTIIEFTRDNFNRAIFYFAGDNELPSEHDHDNFFITGSPHSVHNPEPWLDELKNFLTSLISTGNYDTITGICFGH